jgi:hypothetical protein
MGTDNTEGKMTMSIDSTAQKQLGKLRLSQPTESDPKHDEAVPASETKRVNRLMYVIAQLQTGDLEAVINLDAVAPMEEDGPSRLDPNEARNGRELAEILEDRLRNLLTIGEWGLCTKQRPREKGELGGRMFVEPEETCPAHSPNPEANAG